MTDITFEGSGDTIERAELIQRIVEDYCPLELFPTERLTVRIGNEFWPAASPRTSVATVKWTATPGMSTPILQLKGSGFYWRPIVQSFGPEGRLFSVTPTGVIMHELLGHVGQKVLPWIDERFSSADKHLWTYANAPGAWSTEGGPSIIGLAYGGHFDKLSPHLRAELESLVVTLQTMRPADWNMMDEPERHEPPPPEPEQPDAPPAPPKVNVAVPVRFMPWVTRTLAGEALVPLSDLLDMGWCGPTFTEAPTTVQNAIVRAFPIEEWEHAAIVSKHESGWRADAHTVDRFIISMDGDEILGIRERPANDADIPDGWHIAREDSRGLFQVNVRVHTWATGDLFDPLHNARTARRIFEAAKLASHGNGWYPWTAARRLGIVSV